MTFAVLDPERAPVYRPTGLSVKYTRSTGRFKLTSDLGTARLSTQPEHDSDTPARVAPLAFVSGGSSGIGYGIAERLVEAGYHVTIASRRAEPLADAAARLSDKGVVHHVAADFSSERDIGAAIESHRERFGGLDVLINNAGVGVAGAIDRLAPKVLDRQLAVNLRGYLLAIAAAMPLLRVSNRPHIVNVASIAGIRGQGGLVAYSAAKAGVVGATEALLEEIGPAGIKVTALCPTFVDTPMASWAAEVVGAERLIPVSDVVDMTMAILALSPACNVPVVAMEPPGGLQGWSATVALELASQWEQAG